MNGLKRARLAKELHRLEGPSPVPGTHAKVFSDLHISTCVHGIDMHHTHDNSK